MQHAHLAVTVALGKIGSVKSGGNIGGAEWAIAIGTLAGVVVATWALIQTVRARRGRQREEHWDQALAVDVRSIFTMAPHRVGYKEPELAVTVRNGGNRSIVRVECTVVGADDSPVGRIEFAVVPPHGHESQLISLPGVETVATPKLVSVTFSDAAGNRWRKNGDGALEQLHKARPTIRCWQRRAR